MDLVTGWMCEYPFTFVVVVLAVVFAIARWGIAEK